MKKALFFDLDGTLWNALPSLTEAWNIAMEKNNKKYRYDIKTMTSFMGLTPIETVPLAFYDESIEEGLKLFDLCFKEEIDYLKKKPGKLYSNEIEVLKKLKEKYPLFIISNADCGYIECYLEGCKVSSLFVDHLAAGDTKKEKWENILLMKEKYNLDDVIYIGDTLKDQIESNKAKVKFIHAAYGFGKIENCKYEINSLDELEEKVDILFK